VSSSGSFVTYNNADFAALGRQRDDHPGILLIYLDNRPSDMKTSDILKAVSNVESTYPNGLAGEIVALNGFQW